MTVKPRLTALAYAAVTALLTACATGSTEPAPLAYSPACATANSRQLDFFLGEWDVEWTLLDGRSGRAVNSVVLENGGCVVREHFRDLDGVIEGTGIYSYFAPSQVWAWAWMDSNGAAIMARGGPPADGSAAFALTPQRGADPNKQYRMVFEDVTLDTFTWRYQSRASQVDAWSDESVSHYTRSSRRAAEAPRTNLPIAVALGVAMSTARD